MGLANRLTEPGGALAAATELAHALARLPQTCMREDRASSYEQWALPLDDAIQLELGHGRRSLGSPELDGNVRRFVDGEGRHGSLA